MLAGAVRFGVAVTGLSATLLGLRFSATTVASRGDFVGRTWVIRTGTVTQTFGPAELTAADGPRP